MVDRWVCVDYVRVNRIKNQKIWSLAILALIEIFWWGKKYVYSFKHIEMYKIMCNMCSFNIILILLRLMKGFKNFDSVYPAGEGIPNQHIQMCPKHIFTYLLCKNKCFKLKEQLKTFPNCFNHYCTVKIKDFRSIKAKPIFCLSGKHFFAKTHLGLIRIVHSWAIIASWYTHTFVE